MIRQRHMRRQALRHDGRDEAGFTLVEVIIAFVILMIVLVPVASVLANSIGQAASARERLTALSLAEQYIEKYSNSLPPTTPSHGDRIETNATVPGTPPRQTLSGVTYSVESRFRWASDQGSPDLCTSGAEPTVLEVHVTVSWSNDTQQVSDTTVLNYPPAGIPKDGFLAVQLNGDPAKNPPNDHGGRTWQTRVKRIPVTITSTSFTTTVRPTTYGCVFEQLPPGTYTVSVRSPNTTIGATVPSWVENADERTTIPPASFSVAAGQVSSVTYQYDEGSLVTLSYPSTTGTEGGLTCPGVNKIDCLVVGQVPATASKPTSTPISELSIRTTSGWTVVTPPIAQVAGISCSGSVRCIAVGYARTSGTNVAASVSTGTTSTPSFVPDAVLSSGVSTFTGITCPKSGTQCYATALGTTGAMLLSGSVTSTGVTWSSDAGVPTGLSTISGLSCPHAGTCVAIGSGSAGPVVLSLSSGNTWVTDTLPTPPAPVALSAVTCPAATACFATAATASGAEVLSLSAGTTKWTADPLPTSVDVTAVTQLACPAPTTCYAIGTQSNGSVTGVVLSLTASSTSWVLDTAPTTTAVRTVSCATSTACLVIGTTATGPVTLQRTAPTVWTAWTLPSGTTVSEIPFATCATRSHCFVAATVTVAGIPSAAIFSRTSGTTWRHDTTPAKLTPVLFTGIACTGTSCTASGASETGAFDLNLDTSATGTSWTNVTPSAIVGKGIRIANPPVTIAAATLETSSPLVDTPSIGNNEVGPLFPLQSGYSIAAAECTAESTSASAHVTTVPGATAAVELPLGLLPIEVENARGVPVSDATITAALPSPGACQPIPALPTHPSDPASYSLEQTGPLGLSITDVIYDTYLVTVKAPDGATNTVTIEVTPTSTILTGSTRRPLAVPVPVTVT